MQTDPIADFLTIIRNGVRARKKAVTVRSSHMLVNICRVLKDQGFVTGFQIQEQAPRSLVEVELKYGKGGEPALRGIRRLSKPGKRVYKGRGDLRPVLGGMGVLVLSTPKGVLSDGECRKQSVGGEILFEVW